MDGTCSTSTHGRDEKRGAGSLKCRMEDNIKMNPRDIQCESVACIIWFRLGYSGGIL